VVVLLHQEVDFATTQVNFSLAGFHAPKVPTAALEHEHIRINISLSSQLFTNKSYDTN
jgi:hypothetical protein